MKNNSKVVTYTKEELLEAGMPIQPDVLYEPPANANVAVVEKTAEKQDAAPMTNFEYIESHLKSKSVSGRLCVTLGYDAKDEKGKAEAFKYIASVLQQIKKSECHAGETDKRKLAADLTVCTVNSIIASIIDAASFGIPIDGRGLAYLIKYKDDAKFQVGYKGFIYKLAEYYKDVEFTSEPVFEGDDFTVSDVGGFQTYKHIRNNPFNLDETKMVGLIACLSYYDNSGVRHSKIATLPKAEIDKIRKSAKQDFIWAAWYFEMAKGAALKRLCKLHFATVMGVQQLASYDNEHNYEISETPVGDVTTPKNSAEELSKLLAETPAPQIPIKNHSDSV